MKFLILMLMFEAFMCASGSGQQYNRECDPLPPTCTVKA